MGGKLHAESDWLSSKLLPHTSPRWSSYQFEPPAAIWYSEMNMLGVHPSVIMLATCRVSEGVSGTSSIGAQPKSRMRGGIGAHVLRRNRRLSKGAPRVAPHALLHEEATRVAKTNYFIKSFGGCFGEV